MGGRGPRASGSCLCCARRVGEGGEGTSAQRGAGARHRIAPGCLETLSAVPKFSAYVDFHQPLSLTWAAVRLGGPDVCLLAWGQPPHGPGSPDHKMLLEPWQISLVLSVVEQRGRSLSQGDKRRWAPPLQLLSGTGSLHPPPRSFPISLALSPGSSSREAAMLRLWSRLPSRNGEKTKICPRVFPPFLQNLNFISFFFLNFGISSRFWAKIQVIFVLPETWLPVPWSNSSLLAPAAIWHSQRME